MKYPKIFEPVKIKNTVFKNRLLSSKCGPHFEHFDIDAAFYLSFAQNGAASVTIENGSYPGRELELLPTGESTRYQEYMDLTDPERRAQYSGLIDRLHEFGVVVSVSLMMIEPIYIGLSDFPEYEKIMREEMNAQDMVFHKRDATTEELEAMIEEIAWRARDAKELGADMVTIYMSYRSSMLALSLSPFFNRRTDRFGGGTMEERATLTRELFQKIKEKCGDDFLIEAQISAEEDQPGYTMDDMLDYLKCVEDLVDLVQIRGIDCSTTHSNGINLVKGCPPTLKFAERIKKAGIDIMTAPITGFGDPDDIERYLEEDRTDFVMMARRFISDSDYGKKVAEGRPQDIIPCLWCNECHGPSPSCSVNPKVANREDYPPAGSRKKAAVIGGGVAGMAAALLLDRRGHEVTLYEKSGRLGGQLLAASVCDFKWPIADFLEFLYRKIGQSSIRVLLNTAAEPETLRAEQYDVILCALGSSPKSIPVPGADQDFVRSAEEALLHEEKLGRRVVVIGGADTGRDTALCLARKGHEVTMVTRSQAKLFHDMHVQRAETQAFLNQKGLNYIDHASVQKIEPGKVTLRVKTGIPDQIQGFHAVGVWGMGFRLCEEVPESLPPENSSFMAVDGQLQPRPFDESNMVIKEITLECDDIVVSGGRSCNISAADAFAGIAPEYCVIGDNRNVGDIKNSIADAYAAAMTI